MNKRSPSSPARSATQAASLIEDADGLVIAAGAGMGVDSGLPDFRGRDGFWRAYPALQKARIDFTTIASPDAFRMWPLRAWGFYGHRLALYRNTIPHEGFHLLKRWGERMPRGCFVFTSNVDGQFQRAGFDAGRIYECHGSLHSLQCLEPCGGLIWPAEGFNPEVDEENCRLLNPPPMCPRCGGLARPNVLMFKDADWVESHAKSRAYDLEGWLSTVRRPVVIEVGAGTAIPSVRNFSERMRARFKAGLIRINPDESGVSGDKDVGLALGAKAGLEAIAEALGDGHMASTRDRGDQ
jgi:NAD-dependent SIR2 family protein deacetylase